MPQEKKTIKPTVQITVDTRELDATISKLDTAIEKANKLERILAEIQTNASSLLGGRD